MKGAPNETRTHSCRFATEDVEMPEEEHKETEEEEKETEENME